jgi:hypothetical protein
MPLLMTTINKATSTRLSEVGFVLIILAGIWLVASETPKLRTSSARLVVAGLGLFLGGLLLVIAVHWGRGV